MNNLKTTFFSISYIVTAFITLMILNLAIGYLLDNFIFNLLNWFNGIGLLFKLIILIIGGGFIFGFFLEFINQFTIYLSGKIFDKFPKNDLTVLIVSILGIVNAVWCIVKLWKIPEIYNFWIVCELLIISGFIWGLNSIVISRK